MVIIKAVETSIMSHNEWIFLFTINVYNYSCCHNQSCKHTHQQLLHSAPQSLPFCRCFYRSLVQALVRTLEFNFNFNLNQVASRILKIFFLVAIELVMVDYHHVSQGYERIVASWCVSSLFYVYYFFISTLDLVNCACDKADVTLRWAVLIKFGINESLVRSVTLIKRWDWAMVHHDVGDTNHDGIIIVVRDILLKPFTHTTNSRIINSKNSNSWFV